MRDKISQKRALILNDGTNIPREDEFRRARTERIIGLALLRLTKQVGQIAQRLERLSDAQPVVPGLSLNEADGPLRLESRSVDERFGLLRAVRPALPDPRLVRRIISQRQLRAQFFDGVLFADPAWDMLLDLAAARAEHTRVSVTSLCIASGVPPTTALRWIRQLMAAGLLERVADDTDRRRAFIVLTRKAATAIAHYFAEVDRRALQLN